MHSMRVSGTLGSTYKKKRKKQSGVSYDYSMSDNVSKNLELAEKQQKSRNWRSAIISLGVIAGISALIVLAIWLTTPDSGKGAPRAPFTLDDSLRTWTPSLAELGARWTAGALVYRALHQHEAAAILRLFHNETDAAREDAASPQPHHFLKLSREKECMRDVRSFDVSHDAQWVLLFQDFEQRWRRSGFWKLWALQREADNCYQVGVRLSLDARSNDVSKVQFARWSPLNHSLIFGYKNDLYYMSNPASAHITRLTSTGTPDGIYNGVSDWIYEEEISQAGEMVWWSPDAQFIAFTVANDTALPLYRFPYYESAAAAAADEWNSANSSHPLPYDSQLFYDSSVSVRYPKAGDASNDAASGSGSGSGSGSSAPRSRAVPFVTVHIHAPANASTDRPVAIIEPPTSEKLRSGAYLVAFSWLAGDEGRDRRLVVIEWANRVINYSETIVYQCALTSALHPLAACTMKGNDKQVVSNGWLDVPRAIFPISNEPGAFVTTVIVQSEHSPNPDMVQSRQLVYMRAQTQAPGSALQQVATSALPDEVSAVVAVNAARRELYYQSPHAGDPRSRHVFALPLAGLSNASAARCLSCDLFALNLSSGERQPCLHTEALASPTADYLVIACHSFAVPVFFLRATRPNSKAHVLESNTPVLEFLRGKALPKREFHHIDIHVDPPGVSMKVWAEVWMPPAAAENPLQQFPLLWNVYSGPDSQLVTHRLRLSWLHYLASLEGFVVAAADVPGSAGRGRAFAYQLHRRLGGVEVGAQVAALKRVMNITPQVNKSSVAVLGLSYGGYVTLKMLAHKENVAQCGVAGAPVTDWRLYASAYVERYMGLATAADNHVGYVGASVLLQPDVAAHFNQSRLMLIHGTADDNVHFQHMARLVKLLNRNNVLYDLQLYPDAPHDLMRGDGGVWRRHMIATITNFLRTRCQQQVEVT